MTLKDRQLLYQIRMAWVLDHWRPIKASCRGTHGLEGSEHRVKLNAIKLEGQHVRISIFLQEALVEDLINFIKLVLVTIQSIKYAMLNLCLPLRHSCFEICYVLFVIRVFIRGVIIQQYVRVKRYSLFDAFDLKARIDQAIRHILQMVGSLDLKLRTINGGVVHYHGQCICMVLLSHLLLTLPFLYRFWWTVRVNGQWHVPVHERAFRVMLSHYLEILLITCWWILMSQTISFSMRLVLIWIDFLDHALKRLFNLELFQTLVIILSRHGFFHHARHAF